MKHGLVVTEQDDLLFRSIFSRKAADRTCLQQCSNCQQDTPSGSINVETLANAIKRSRSSQFIFWFILNGSTLFIVEKFLIFLSISLSNYVFPLQLHDNVRGCV